MCESQQLKDVQESIETQEKCSESLPFTKNNFPAHDDSESSAANSLLHSDKPRRRFEIKKWNAVALWSWDIIVDNCAICRNHVMELCIECQAQGNQPEHKKCTVAFGVCNHAFHFHCISRWLTTRQVCPLDNTAWEFQKFSPRNETEI
jgi:E3 ubiquitin-protein ligase RBX1